MTYKIKDIVESMGCDYHEFSEWALGDKWEDTELNEVPRIWNQRHPECPICIDDKVIKSLVIMVELYKEQVLDDRVLKALKEMENETQT